MNARTPPPRGLGWADAWPARVAVIALAVVSLAVSIYVGYRYVQLVNCLSDRDAADQRRTAVVAAATDVRDRADLQLLRGGPDPHALVRAAVAAREHLDRVRAANPAPPVRPCS